jgi:hypothetical protein
MCYSGLSIESREALFNDHRIFGGSAEGPITDTTVESADPPNDGPSPRREASPPDVLAP